MPWTTIEDVPTNVKTHQGAKLTLEQANRWAQFYDAIKNNPEVATPAAVAWTQWNKEFVISEDGKSWSKREQSLSLSLSREITSTVVLQGSAIQAMFDKYPATPEERGYLVFRKRMGEDAKGWIADELLLIDEPTTDILKDILWEGEFRLYEVHPDIAGVIGHAIVDELPEGGAGFRIVTTKTVEQEGTAPEPTEEGFDEHRCDSFQHLKLSLQKLAEEDAERTGETKLLMVNGLMIAEGVWKNTKFMADVLKDALDRVGNKRIDVEHADETWNDVKGFNYKPRWNEELKGIDVSGAIFDPRVIQWHER